MHHLGIGSDHTRKRMPALADEEKVSVVEPSAGDVLSTPPDRSGALLLRNQERGPGRWADPTKQTYVATQVGPMSRLMTKRRGRDSNPRSA